MRTVSRNALTAALLTACLAASASAATIAQYHFDEGPDGAGLTANTGTPTSPSPYTADATGNGNHLQTFNSPDSQGTNTDTSPKYSTTIPAATIPQTGTANNFSFRFDPSTTNEDIYSAGDTGGGASGTTLNDHNFTAFTIEATVNIIDSNRFNNFVGEDGNPVGAAVNNIAPIQIKQRQDDQKIQMEWIDSSGAARSIESTFTVQTGVWYSIAAVDDGSTASLYIKGPSDSDYVLQGSLAVSGGIYDTDQTWTVGRGFYNGGITDWTNGYIDEVRISDTALSTSQFLFNTPASTSVPTPAALPAGLALLAGVGLRSRRRARV